MLENPSTVQLDHRILATTTCFSVLSLFAYARSGRVAAALPANVRKGVHGLLHVTLAQAGALALLTTALILGQRLRIPKSLLATLNKRVQAAAKSSAASTASKTATR
ncbi:unnamed protein product [Parascedosporium putredinis]|uniref:Uncharacterized protein n=1 Tax=Parascedosporium putredinis TaxID=1442378 RepID=A0A9P1MGL0_9PEZI|nr:unnamed protein product [Parascedosporium putredinis]CAI8004685.1 unnamed protein product [Parascedosporium putredinis]